MRRLYHADLPARGGEVTLDPEAARHAKVLRLTVGDALVLFDGQGREARGTLTCMDEPLRCRLGAPERVPHRGPRVVLCQCLPKGGKLDAIVRGATEVGVVAIHLVVGERSVARGVGKRIERLGKIAREAARQSGRADVPEIVAPAPLAEVAKRAPEVAIRIACVSGGGPIPTGADEAWVVVGPEGGLSPEEIAALAALGFAHVDLGPTILRTETAAIVATALVRAALS